MKYLLLASLFLISCSDPRNAETVATADGAEEVQVQQADTSVEYTYTVFEVNTAGELIREGFGFEIIGQSPGSIRIRQANIPAVQGNQPFISKEDASATAQLMISKLKRGILPPAVSVEELDSLGVVY